MKREYGWEPGTDQLLGVSNSGGWAGVVLHDAALESSVVGVADASDGTLIKRYPLNAWGTTAADTGVLVRFRAAGHEYDQGSKLYYMRARYYDPGLGRFLSEDPSGISGGLNLYAYTGNDPINRLDPTGLGEQCKDGYEIGPDGRCWMNGIGVTGTSDGPTPAQRAAEHQAQDFFSGRGNGNIEGPGYGGTGGDGGRRYAGGPSNATASDSRTSAQKASCVIGGVTNGSIRGAIRGLYAGAIQGYAVSQPIALTNAARASVVAGAITVEAGGSGAIPTFITTYVGTRAAVTGTWAVRGAAVGLITGGVFGGTVAYVFDKCPVSPLY